MFFESKKSFNNDLYSALLEYNFIIKEAYFLIISSIFFSSFSLNKVYKVSNSPDVNILS